MYSIKYVTFVLLVFLQGFACNGQNFLYQVVPPTYIPPANQQYTAEASQFRKSAVDLTKFLPNGYVTDGSIDYTDKLQQGINANQVVLMPDFPVMTSGIHLNNGSTLIFQEKSLLKMAASSQVFYEIIGINRVKDVNVYFAKIEGDRGEHIGTKGEWGFGIGIISSNNVRILAPNISNCWGDGIYINNAGTSENKITSNLSNIFIDGAQIDNNRRNGISIIDGENITVKNSILSNTHGTMPMAGIDIEPNNGNGELKNILIDSVITFNNSTYGMLVSLALFAHLTQKDVDITINNCVVDESEYGMTFVFDRPKRKDFVNAKGMINVINSVWKNNRTQDLALPDYSATNNIILKFQNVAVMKNGEKHKFLDKNLIKDTKIIFN